MKTEFKQIKLADAIGKTIKGIEVGYDKHLIAYTDGTFSFFVRYEEWGSTHQSNIVIKYENFIENLGINRDGTTYFTETQEMFINLGIIDGEQLIKDAKDRIEEYVEAFNKSERKKYEELKAKFEK